MKRVAFTLIGGGKGTGGYNYLLNLLRVLGENESTQVTPVLLLGDDLAAEQVAPFRELAGVEVVQSPAMNAARKTRALAAALLLGADAAHRRLLQQQRIDVVFESAQFFGWRLGLPVVAWIPDFQHRHLRHMFTPRGYWKREVGFLAEIAAGRTLMLSSNDARADCERFYPATIGRTRAVRFAVPAREALSRADARAVADSYDLPEHYFFMPNQFSKHKNHGLVLDALAILKARGVGCVIVSSGKQADERHPGYFPAFRARLEASGLQAQLRLLGMIPYADLAALMQASVALLNPSLFEGWSTPVEEARALGVPLVLSDLAVHREQAGADAVYFERHSAAALADALQGFQPVPECDRAHLTTTAHAAAAGRVRRFAADFADLVVACAGGPQQAKVVA